MFYFVPNLETAIMKKKIPLAILEILQPVADQNLQFIEPVNNPEVLFHLKDKDPNSDFYFKVVKQEAKDQSQGYYLDYKPNTKTDISASKPWVKLESINNTVQKWIDLVAAYNKIHTIYDDPILKAYQEEFENELGLKNNEHLNVPFKLNQLIFLDEYLTGFQQKLITLKEGRPQEVQNELILLASDAAELQKNVSTQTKKDVLVKLCRLWARAQKIGVDVIKDVFVSIASDLIKKLLTGGQ